MGSVDKKQTYELLDYFYDQGGNFIDTASNYVRTLESLYRIVLRRSCSRYSFRL